MSYNRRDYAQNSFSGAENLLINGKIFLIPISVVNHFRISFPSLYKSSAVDRWKISTSSAVEVLSLDLWKNY
jgi:hypothetical protein